MVCYIYANVFQLSTQLRDAANETGVENSVVTQKGIFENIRKEKRQQGQK